MAAGQEGETSWWVFRTSGTWLAVPPERVSRMAPMGALTTVPLRPPVLKGVTNAGGTLLAVLDLTMLLGLTSLDDEKAHGGRCLVMEHTAGSFGLVADDFAGIVTLPSSAMRPSADGSRGRVQGHFSWKGHVVTILDTDELIAASDAAIGG